MLWINPNNYLDLLLQEVILDWKGFFNSLKFNGKIHTFWNT